MTRPFLFSAYPPSPKLLFSRYSSFSSFSSQVEPPAPFHELTAPLSFRPAVPFPFEIPFFPFHRSITPVVLFFSIGVYSRLHSPFVSPPKVGGHPIEDLLFQHWRFFLRRNASPSTGCWSGKLFQLGAGFPFLHFLFVELRLDDPFSNQSLTSALRTLIPFFSDKLTNLFFPNASFSTESEYTSYDYPWGSPPLEYFGSSLCFEVLRTFSSFQGYAPPSW